VLIQDDGVERHLRLFHSSFAEWLADADRSDAAHVDPADGHRLLADLAWARYLDGTLVGSAYLGSRLEVHLAASGQHDRLARATSDRTYLAARLRAASDDSSGARGVAGTRSAGAGAAEVDGGRLRGADKAALLGAGSQRAGGVDNPDDLDAAALWRISDRCQAAGDHWRARYALAAAVESSRNLTAADRPGLEGVEGYLTLVGAVAHGSVVVGVREFHRCAG
jgi:hypothetical protein